MYYGSAWYPEHWPEARWRRDLELMKAAGMNVVRVAEFAWLDPELMTATTNWILAQAQVPTLALPPAVELCHRVGNGRETWILINHGRQAQTVNLPGRAPVLLPAGEVLLLH